MTEGTPSWYSAIVCTVIGAALQAVTLWLLLDGYNQVWNCIVFAVLLFWYAPLIEKVWPAT